MPSLLLLAQHLVRGHLINVTWTLRASFTAMQEVHQLEHLAGRADHFHVR